MTASDCITIPLTKGYSTVIDSTDSDLALLKWKVEIKSVCYAGRSDRTNGFKTALMHAIILSRMLGRDLLPGEQVDHIDRNGLNNRRENLRLANSLTNAQNRKRRSDNSTGYKGVGKDGNRFRAVITANKKRINLGSYATPELAAMVYDAAAIKYHGEFALTNKMLKGES